MMVGHDNMKKAFFLLSAFFSISYSLQLLGALQNHFFFFTQAQSLLSALTLLFPSTCCDLQNCLYVDG